MSAWLDERRAQVRTALEGDPWAEAAANAHECPTGDPTVDRAWAWWTVRYETMLVEGKVPGGRQLPPWAQILGRGWPTDGCGIRHDLHGLWDLAQGVFRRPAEQR